MLTPNRLSSACPHPGDWAAQWTTRYTSAVQASVTASDETSGIAYTEYSPDGGAWRAYSAPVSFDDGQHSLQFRTTDMAGLQTESEVFTFQVDTQGPHINLPSRWYIWESGEFIVKDDYSKVVAVSYEIRDGQNRWKKVERSWTPNAANFSGTISWNRVFADGVTAPIGRYAVCVYAEDAAGNVRRREAEIIIPPPNATPLPTFTPAPTPTNTPVPTEEVFAPPMMPPQATATPLPEVVPGKPASPEKENTVIFGSTPKEPASSSTTASNILWGAVAAAAIGAFAAAAAETKKRRDAKRAAFEEKRKERQRLQAIWDANGAAIYAANQSFKEAYGKEMDAATREQAIKNATVNGHFNAEAYAGNLAKAATPPPPPPNPYTGDAERIRAGANEIDDEKKIGYQDVPPSQPAPDLQAGLQALYEGRKAGEVQLSDVACTPENIQQPKNWWQKAWDWAKSPATSWGVATEEESVKLMQKAKGFPDISIPLPMLKGFGMDDVAGPLKYTVKTDTTVRLFGRVLDDAAPGVLTGIGWGITVAPNFVKNVREENPWHQTAADLIIDSAGFVVSELAGWGAGALAGFITGGNPIAILTAKIAVDGFVSVKWDEWAEDNRWNKWLSQRLEEGAQSFEQKVTTSIQETMDTEKYPSVPTPPTVPHLTGTPVPVEQNPATPPSETTTPQPGTPTPPPPSTP